jgi:hypothetical protein
VITNWDGDIANLGIGLTAIGSSAGVPDPPVCTPPGGAKDYLWIACGVELNGSNVPTGAPTNYSNFLSRITSTGTNTVGIGSAERSLNASSENPGTVPISGGGTNWGAATLAIPYGVSAPPAADSNFMPWFM